jgi:DNA-directed RNA polymerase subunit RPC12/RpoP
MARPKRPKPQRETIAACATCRRTHIMTGTAAQLRRERVLRCPRCKGNLSVVMEVERL